MLQGTRRISAPETIARPLRVMHVIPTLTGGGAENFLCALVDNFDERRVSAAILAIYPTDIPLSPEARVRIPVIEIWRKGRYDPGFFKRMLAAIRAYDPDIVHTHLHNGKYWGRLAALFARVPVVLFTEHNPCAEPRILPELLVDFLVNRVTDGIVTFCDGQRRFVSRMERLPLEKVPVIETGISLPRPSTPLLRHQARQAIGADEDTLAVIVLSRLIKRKNQLLAIRAIQCLSASARRRVRVYLAGSGEDDAMLRAAAQAADVSNEIVFLGHRSDAVQFLYGADVLYMPSLAEGMPLAILEAMSIGVPVVSTPWTGVHELLRDGELGTILRDFTPQTSAEVFESLLRCPDSYRCIADKACNYVRERHDIRNVARSHEELYEMLARRHGILS